MEGVQHHSLPSASCLPPPQCLPPQNQLHHLQRQQYLSLVWVPLCPTCLVPGPQGERRSSAVEGNSCPLLP